MSGATAAGHVGKVTIHLESQRPPCFDQAGAGSGAREDPGTLIGPGSLAGWVGLQGAGGYTTRR